MVKLFPYFLFTQHTVIRNTDKTCPKGGMMAQRNEAVPYETKGMEGGMDMFEKQFDGVVKVKLLAIKVVQSISFF